MNRNFLVILLIAAAVLSFGVTGAQAANFGSDSGTWIVNGLNAGGALPDAVGEVALTFANAVGVDTTQTDTTPTIGSADSLAFAVWIAYDLEGIDSQSKIGIDTGSPGESVAYEYTVSNQGNVSTSLKFTHKWSGQAGDGTNWGSASYEIYFEANGNATFEAAGDSQLPNSPDAFDSTLPPDNIETAYAVVSIPLSAAGGDSSVSVFILSDNAPAGFGSTTGDGWQNGQPLFANDSEDTQVDTITTFVTVAVVRIAKNIASHGNFRPGDTVQYAIIYDNDGASAATNLFIYEAIPSNTTYQVGSTVDSSPHLGTLFTAYEVTLASNAYDDAEGANITKIRWEATNDLAPSDGDDLTIALDESPGAGDQDAGTVRFTVSID